MHILSIAFSFHFPTPLFSSFHMFKLARSNAGGASLLRTAAVDQTELSDHWQDDEGIS